MKFKWDEGIAQPKVFSCIVKSQTQPFIAFYYSYWRVLTLCHQLICHLMATVPVPSGPMPSYARWCLEKFTSFKWKFCPILSALGLFNFVTFVIFILGFCHLIITRERERVSERWYSTKCECQTFVAVDFQYFGIHIWNFWTNFQPTLNDESRNSYSLRIIRILAKTPLSHDSINLCGE